MPEKNVRSIREKIKQAERQRVAGAHRKANLYYRQLAANLWFRDNFPQQYGRMLWLAHVNARLAELTAESIEYSREASQYIREPIDRARWLMHNVELLRRQAATADYADHQELLRQAETDLFRIRQILFQGR